MEGNEPKPLLLTDGDMRRVHKWVDQFLPAEYDRDFIADTIILNAWLKEVPHVSRDYVRNKCISAWRSLRRERSRNEKAAKDGATKTDAMSGYYTTGPKDLSEQDKQDHKILIDEATQAVLTPFERRLIWMRYYNGQTLEEISEKVTLRRDQVSKAIEVALYKMRVHLT